MNEQIFVLASQKKNTNHILHLLLCIPTCGLWLIVWAGVAASNRRRNDRIQRQINDALYYKMQGLDDIETYQRLGEDEAARRRQRAQLFVVMAITVVIVVFIKTKL
ncbi:hypothetical protein ACQCLI_15115 [Pseudomonas nitroreducens]|uniref:hypothetical protein n=1 Tax=Pseudomonas nitroreducens TaxID=46680 RepID=UPI00037948B0|nr:hypothetical protein [Pseudomonas nitroreducens]